MSDLKVQTITADSLESTIKLAEKIGSRLIGGELIELNSDLGGGKTTFTKGLLSGAGSKDLVSSPSFTICNQYRAGDLNFYHFDFYRLNDPGIIRRELLEVMDDKKAVIIIEWAGVVEDVLPEDKLSVTLVSNGETSRLISLNSSPSLNYLTEGL
jgi:tRNA threonylcarbamoyladenosine biosynthesis protein TsaE